MKRIAIFASGSGTNAENIIKYFSGDIDVEISIILSNKKDAYVLERAKKHSIPTISFNRDDFYKNNKVLDLLISKNIDLIVLAGFLWLIPTNLTHKYNNKMINIHPALLPKYGGKGMFGMNVHKAIIENKEEESGITIHYVNEKYDEGEIIFQAKCEIKLEDTPESLAKKIHELEYAHFPKTVGKIIKQL